MPRSRIFGITAVIVISLVVVVVVTLALTPGETNPAFAVAADFMNAAGKGDDATALALLSDDMQAYVAANCPDGSVSACINGYIPPEWGGLISAVFRRAAPDGANWNVDLIATYEKDTGASGVCSYYRMEQDAAGAWRIYGWAGFLWCGDGRSRNMATNPDAPNRVP
jgi:hypothetical protein